MLDREWIKRQFQRFLNYISAIFVRKGNPADTKRVTGRYNVLDYGLNNTQDGSIDNSALLTAMLNSIPEGSVVYFPQGVYVFHDTVEIRKAVKFLGETIVKHRSNTESVLQPQSAIRFNPSEANKTLFVRYTGEFDVEGLSFFGSSNFNLTYNTDPFNGILPYPIWKTTTVLEGINAIDCAYHGVTSTGKTNNGTMAIVKNCTFMGFSGYALAYEDHRYVNNCSFLRCNISIIFTGSDNMVQNSWICAGNIGILCTHEHRNFTNLEVSNCWCDQMSGHFIYCRNLESATEVNMLLVNDCWVDMIDNAAIYCEGTLVRSRITGRFSRTGMSYAHTNNQTVERTRENYYKMDAIVAYRVYYCEIDISLHKRNIGQHYTPEGAPRIFNPDGICPYRAVSYYNKDGGLVESDITVDEYYNDVFENDGTFQPFNTHIKCRDTDMIRHALWNYENNGILFRTTTPVDKARAPKENMLCMDTAHKKVYVSTASDNVAAWKLLFENTTYETLPNAKDLFGTMIQYTGPTNVANGLYRGCSYESVIEEVKPSGNENPKNKLWHELIGGEYVLSTDTQVDVNKTYYVYKWKQLTISIDQISY